MMQTRFTPARKPSARDGPVDMPQSRHPGRTLGIRANPGDGKGAIVSLRHKRRELHGVNGAVGLAAELAGHVGQHYSNGIATFLMLSIWMVGATPIILFTEPTDKK